MVSCMFLTALMTVIIIIIIIIIIGLIKLWSMRWLEDVGRIRDKINVHWLVVGKGGEKKPL